MSSEQRWWNAVLARDAGRDGEFVFAVSSTGVYCRPSCPAKRPRRENVTFFHRPEEAERAGYRACLRCRPKAINGNAQAEMLKSICRYIEQHLDEPLTLQRLANAFHLSPFHLQRVFREVPWKRRTAAEVHAPSICGFLPSHVAQTQSAGRA